MVYFPIYIHSSSVLKKKMLELKKEMCKHLAEDSFNADDADACSNVYTKDIFGASEVVGQSINYI